MSKMAKESEENFVMLNAKVSFPIPKEINKADIEEICKILQVQGRPDLVEVMKNLVILSGKDFTEENKTVFLSINKLPPEMLKKILGMLDINSLGSARLTCKLWKLIIDNCDIMEKALSKISKSNKLKFFVFIHDMFDMNFSHFQKRSPAQ